MKPHFLWLLTSLMLWAGALYAQELPFVCGGWDRIEERAGVLAKPVAGSGAVVSGTDRALVIFAQFKDEAVSDEAPAWREQLFDPGLPGSLRHFYAAMSFGAHTWTGRVCPSAIPPTIRRTCMGKVVTASLIRRFCGRSIGR